MAKAAKSTDRDSFDPPQAKKRKLSLDFLSQVDQVNGMIMFLIATAWLTGLNFFPVESHEQDVLILQVNSPVGSYINVVFPVVVVVVVVVVYACSEWMKSPRT